MSSCHEYYTHCVLRLWFLYPLCPQAMVIPTLSSGFGYYTNWVSPGCGYLYTVYPQAVVIYTYSVLRLWLFIPTLSLGCGYLYILCPQAVVIYTYSVLRLWLFIPTLSLGCGYYTHCILGMWLLYPPCPQAVFT